MSFVERLSLFQECPLLEVPPCTAVELIMKKSLTVISAYSEYIHATQSMFYYESVTGYGEFLM